MQKQKADFIARNTTEQELREALALVNAEPLPPRPPWDAPGAKKWEVEYLRREAALRKLQKLGMA